MRQVRERLYIGTAHDAGIFLSGARQGFTHILSVAPVCLDSGCNFNASVPDYWKENFDAVAAKMEEACPKMSGKLPVRKIVPLVDSEEQDIVSSMFECLEFIEEGVQEGIVLVHCVGGVSRSASVVMAYLMWKEGLSVDEALQSLRSCREGAKPNKGFMEQLRSLESMLRAAKQASLEKGEQQQQQQVCKLCKRMFEIAAYERPMRQPQFRTPSVKLV